jgi:diguanylate cyclase (GGDEF)-like protein
MAQLKVLKVGLFVRKHLDSPEFTLHRNYTGFEVDHGKTYAIPENHDLIRLFTEKYNCYTLDEIRAKGIPLNDLEPMISLEPSLLVPLQAKGKINGIIILADRINARDFDAYEKEYIFNAATLASIAINNAVLFEMTTTDMMTKLKMKHNLCTKLDEWLIKAKSDDSFSMLMFDIDFFKKVNDTYGHSVGDIVLKYVARIIMGATRGADIAARYGGEEFVVLLSRPGPAMAINVAERIRKAIEDSRIRYKDEQLHITISCGIACYDPALDRSSNAMIERVDQALYKSKQNGRNRITVA